MSKGYAAPMAPTAGNTSSSGGNGGGGMAGPIMKRDINPRASSAFRKSGGGPSNFQTGGGKRLFGRLVKR